MTEEKNGGVIDLSSALSQYAPKTEPETETAPPAEDDIMTQIEGYMNSLRDSVAAVHIGIRTLAQRVSSLERQVSYLLSQDPKAGPKIREYLNKMDKEAGVQNDERKEGTFAGTDTEPQQ